MIYYTMLQVLAYSIPRAQYKRTNHTFKKICKYQIRLWDFPSEEKGETASNIWIYTNLYITKSMLTFPHENSISILSSPARIEVFSNSIHMLWLLKRWRLKMVNLIEFEMELGFRKRVQIFVWKGINWFVMVRFGS